MLHAKHASDSGYQSVVIKTPDSDVIILACYFQCMITAQIIILTGTKLRSRYIDIQKVCGQYDDLVLKALPGLHAFTGCDTVSSFSGKGKRKAFDIIKCNDILCNQMANLGTEYQPNETYEDFVCALYGYANYHDVNELRYHLFCSKNVQSNKLPPCKDSLQKHVQRACYQAYIWKKALDSKPNIPSPDGNGWAMIQGELTIDWFDLLPAPAALLEFLTCSCKTKCQTGRCTCFSNRLSCTQLCKCGEDCTNHSENADSDTSDDDM